MTCTINHLLIERGIALRKLGDSRRKEGREIMSAYEEQWRTFEEAIKLGWKGTKPSVLGTYRAEKALESARAAIEANK